MDLSGPSTEARRTSNAVSVNHREISLTQIREPAPGASDASQSKFNQNGVLKSVERTAALIERNGSGGEGDRVWSGSG
ncbi:unnamed protein product [Danaus chrysippus]|uniref:(African queen) hypothetical protein n=1 Tax=Danaus chrysippus TaxID=151541 RepID=A0A8J2QHC2_9NEOP|nr:unnamed protein product [Danaus chrysippus]